MPDRILLNSIEFYGRHGVGEAERTAGRRFAIDLVLELELTRPCATDDLQDTVDYGDVCERVLAIGQGPPVNLLEALAERIAQECLASYPRLAGIEVTVRKIHPPVGATVGAAGVTIHRSPHVGARS